MTQPLEMARRLWGLRCLTFARRGDVRVAAESAEALRRLAAADAECLVIVARAYSLCLRVKSDSSPKLPVATQPRQGLFKEKALDALKNAFRVQPALAQNGWLEPDFNPLYAVPEYRGLVGAVRPRRPRIESR